MFTIRGSRSGIGNLERRVAGDEEIHKIIVAELVEEIKEAIPKFLSRSIS